jgi:hypothetical protein
MAVSFSDLLKQIQTTSSKCFEATTLCEAWKDLAIASFCVKINRHDSTNILLLLLLCWLYNWPL